MLLKSFSKQLAAALAGLLLSGVCLAAPSGLQARAQRNKRPNPGANFRLAASKQTPGTFDLMISDGEEAVISGSFTSDQVKNFRDVMAEARAFALTEEGVGNGEPQTTRFYNEESAALIVDVMKFESQSQFFLTYETEIGRITVEGGTLDRKDKKEAGLFYDLLSKLELELKKQAPAPK
ncbi:MAG TPA: hypothetical protein VE262_18210 [Blastocatellia bacterium]|nr:hypothetical protein [Blastocatellia bacterium]